VNQIITRT